MSSPFCTVMGTKLHGHKAQIFGYSEEYTIKNNNVFIFGNFITKNKKSPLEIQKIYALRSTLYALRSCPSNAQPTIKFQT